MIPLEDISYVGKGLDRPESVLTTQTGDIFVSHKGQGIMRICPDGRQFLLHGETVFGGCPIVPNGIALRNDGSFLVANISDAGGLFVLDAEGLRLHHGCSNMPTLPPVNFVMVDQLDKVWITVSSKLKPRSLAYRRNVQDGYVGLLGADGSFDVLIDDLHYTNEIRPDYEHGWLYIAETFGQKISRIKLDETGVHGKPELFSKLPRGAFVDGIELDGAGGLYAACIVSSELYHIDPDGSTSLLIGERDKDWIDEVENALDNGTMERKHFDTTPANFLPNISSVGFLGELRDKIVCGNLLGQSLPVIKAPRPGPEPSHWKVIVPEWGELQT